MKISSSITLTFLFLTHAVCASELSLGSLLLELDDTPSRSTLQNSSNLINDMQMRISSREDSEFQGDFEENGVSTGIRIKPENYKGYKLKQKYFSNQSKRLKVLNHETNNSIYTKFYKSYLNLKYSHLLNKQYKKNIVNILK